MSTAGCLVVVFFFCQSGIDSRQKNGLGPNQYTQNATQSNKPKKNKVRKESPKKQQPKSGQTTRIKVNSRLSKYISETECTLETSYTHQIKDREREHPKP